MSSLSETASEAGHGHDELLQQQRLHQLFEEQQSEPMTIHSVRVHGARHTRKGLLDNIFSPLVSDQSNVGSTLGDVLGELRTALTKINRFEIFHPDPQLWLTKTDSTLHPDSSPTDTDIDIRVTELGRLRIKGGTDFGNGEGSGYASVLWRNVLGGAEMLTLNASRGTRTRSAYNASLATPVAGNPDVRLALDVFASSTAKPWASHEEVVEGTNATFSWLSEVEDIHTLEVAMARRRITDLADTASPTVRADAGDSMKHHIRHTFRRERRDNPRLPQSGYSLRSLFEVAGWGPLGGDVTFAKTELNMNGAVPLNFLGPSRPTGISVGGGLRFGALYPLAPGLWGGRNSRSKINDRFQLGGPTDVRGFTLGGLGPHDGTDAVGGDLVAAGSVNVLLPLPRQGSDSSLRLHLFANGGRLVALREPKEARSHGRERTVKEVNDSVVSALHELTNGPPSVTAGIGLIYGHPAARFELNFGLPVVMRHGESCAKGFQIGVGLDFM